MYVGAVITGLLLCVVWQRLLVLYCVWWGCVSWFDIVCVVAVITGLVLCGGAVITDLVICVVGQ